VVVGRLVPAGTGLTYHAERKAEREKEKQSSSEEDTDLDSIEQALSDALSAEG